MTGVTPENFDQTYPEAVREKYWRLVKLTMEEVLQRPSEAVEKFRQATKERPIPEQILMYHDTPLNLATGLAGIPANGVTRAQRDHYHKLESSIFSADLK